MDLFHDLYESNLHRFGFRNTQQQEREGHLFTIDSDLGSGYYWVYTYGNLFAISDMELLLQEDVALTFRQPDDLHVIGHYDSVSGTELPGNHRIETAQIREYRPSGDSYQYFYNSERPIKGCSLNFLPSFYEEYLSQKYPRDMEAARDLFTGILSGPFPEFARVMRDIQRFRGTGLSAKLYYESKVTEALSLLIRQAERQVQTATRILPEDFRRISDITDYIANRPGTDLRVGELARRACMSTTKFKIAFKAATGLPASRYIAQVRMAKARELLLEADNPVSEVARSVGYGKPGAFSAAYRSIMGELPSETQKLREPHR